MLHRPVPDQHSVNAVDPAGQDIIEEERLVGMEIPEAFGFGHPRTSRGICEQRCSDAVIEPFSALTLRPKEVGNPPSR